MVTQWEKIYLINDRSERVLFFIIIDNFHENYQNYTIIHIYRPQNEIELIKLQGNERVTSQPLNTLQNMKHIDYIIKYNCVLAYDIHIMNCQRLC